MMGMIQVVFNEWKILLRNKGLVYLTLFFLLNIVLVTWLGIVQNQKQIKQQQAAQEYAREKWESIEDMNPHGAAHYGSYAFKPITALSSLDEGVNTITGNVLRLEGHVQNEIAYSEASQSLSVSKFGKLRPALLLKYVIPLLIVFLAFRSINGERETGRLKLLVFQGISVPKLILAKSLSIWLYALALLLITIATQTLVSSEVVDSNIIYRTFFILFSYAAYYYIISGLTTYLSARLKSSTAALSSILSIWVLWTIFLPRIWGSASESMVPLPSKQEFYSAMEEDRSQGIDGHNPSDQRREELEQNVLAEYGVDSVEQLPINFDGIIMQKDEEYGNQVWDKHFKKNYDILKQQKNIYQLSGLLNPFASLQSTSMGFSGSDMIHHLDFLKQAEIYRRDLIKSLNDAHAYGGSTTGDWGWTIDKEFFKSVEDFSYDHPHIKSLITHYWIDLTFLSFWVLITSLFILLTAKKIKLV